MRIMTGAMLTGMFGMNRWCFFAMGVGHIRVPPSFKIYELVPSLGHHRLQITTSSRIGPNNKAFTQGCLGDVPTDSTNYSGQK